MTQHPSCLCNFYANWINSVRQIKIYQLVSSLSAPDVFLLCSWWSTCISEAETVADFDFFCGPNSVARSELKANLSPTWSHMLQAGCLSWACSYPPPHHLQEEEGMVAGAVEMPLAQSYHGQHAWCGDAACYRLARGQTKQMLYSRDKTNQER